MASCPCRRWNAISLCVNSYDGRFRNGGVTRPISSEFTPNSIEYFFMRILDFLRYDGIIASLKAGSKEEVLMELVESVAKANSNLDKAGLIKTLIERENLGSTGIGGGVAIPHGKFEGLGRLTGAFGRSVGGIDFSSMDNHPAHLFFLLVAPKNSAGDHLKALARISRLLKDPLLKSGLRQADSADDIFSILEEYDRRIP